MPTAYNAYQDMVMNAAQYNNEWSAAQAQKQMDFQERMSNTAHQREVADLQAAGLNPVLSAHTNGASTPTGAAATADSSLVGALVDVMKEFGSAMVSSAVGAASSGISDSVLRGDEVHEGLSPTGEKWHPQRNVLASMSTLDTSDAEKRLKKLSNLIPYDGKDGPLTALRKTLSTVADSGYLKHRAAGQLYVDYANQKVAEQKSKDRKK